MLPPDGYEFAAGSTGTTITMSITCASNTVDLFGFYDPEPQAFADDFDEALARRPVIRDQGPPPVRRQPAPRSMRPPPRRLSWLVEGRGR